VDALADRISGLWSEKRGKTTKYAKDTKVSPDARSTVPESFRFLFVSFAYFVVPNFLASCSKVAGLHWDVADPPENRKAAIRLWRRMAGRLDLLDNFGSLRQAPRFDA
jgi:hypothetical protein